MWKTISPQLPVADVLESQAWFRDVLGFKVTYTDGDRFGAVEYGKSELFLERAEPGWAKMCCCVRVEDADFMYAIYKERGAVILSEPADKPWRMREFTIEDPNGHRFRIGHSTR